jgi:hypothetical protein
MNTPTTAKSKTTTTTQVPTTTPTNTPAGTITPSTTPATSIASSFIESTIVSTPTANSLPSGNPSPSQGNVSVPATDNSIIYTGNWAKTTVTSCKINTQSMLATGAGNTIQYTFQGL